MTIVVVATSKAMLACSWYAGLSYQAFTSSNVGNWMMATPSTAAPTSPRSCRSERGTSPDDLP
jgi:hypothetical protein